MARIDREILVTFGDGYYCMLASSVHAMQFMYEGKAEAAYTYAKIAANQGRWVLERLERMEKWNYASPLARGEFVRSGNTVRVPIERT